MSAEHNPEVVWQTTAIRRSDRPTAGATVWLTGLSGAGKSSVAAEVERQLLAVHRPAYLLDGDNLRHGLNADLGFTARDRTENIRRVGEVAKLFADAGLVSIVALISPYLADRHAVRNMHEQDELRFIEVFVDTPLAVCESRDVKGMYAKARAGDLRHFTGVDDRYEAPAAPDVVLRPVDGSPSAMAGRVLDVLLPRAVRQHTPVS
ncbi:adenylyl-sulfate kinase [Tamaricihabitans halophyticus]|uniref:Adenylyl-sulfate kinase n=1 Tax=Tamaricihabitans halophyticus TaxID=1262583 RepID=A0A4R2QPV1_9PSEU|nr:adenylyl-sulfate kinase [Tamaricihabitans halophyticus]